MKRILAVSGLLIALMILIAACAAASEESSKGETSAVPGAPGVAVPAPVPPREGSREVPPPEVIITEGGFASSGDTGTTLDTERMIVRNGNISLVVEDVPIAIERITTTAEGFGGYVVNSNVWQNGERLSGSISIRVPVESFETTLQALRDLAVEVTQESTTSSDVTEEYVDLAARLGNLRATEEQLLRIMEKAETVEDILDVQRELSRTRGEIEQTQARMQYLEQTSATAIISVSLQQSKLFVELSASTTRVKEGEDIQFYGQVAGGFAPYSYEWDLGDDTVTTEQYPIHRYQTDGPYTISLTVTDDRGNSDTEIRQNYVTVLPGWSHGNIAGSAWNGLVGFGRVIVDILIWVGIFSPVWIVIGGITYLILRRFRKRGKQPEQAGK